MIHIRLIKASANTRLNVYKNFVKIWISRKSKSSVNGKNGNRSFAGLKGNVKVAGASRIKPSSLMLTDILRTVALWYTKLAITSAVAIGIKNTHSSDVRSHRLRNEYNARARLQNKIKKKNYCTWIRGIVLVEEKGVPEYLFRMERDFLLVTLSDGLTLL